MTLGGPNVQRIIGVLDRSSPGSALIVVSRDGSAAGDRHRRHPDGRRVLALIRQERDRQDARRQQRGTIMLTPQQTNFFHTFGFLKLPGLFREEFPRIEASFHEVWETQGGGHAGGAHDGMQRSALVPFIDKHEYLSGSHRRPSNRRHRVRHPRRRLQLHVQRRQFLS